MTWQQVKPVMLRVPSLALCRHGTTTEIIDGRTCKPYIGHRRGCPNIGQKRGCPSAACKTLTFPLDITQPIYAVWNRFDFGAHVARMLEKPGRTQRQAECCLYWQGTARKALKEEAWAFLYKHRLSAPWCILQTPEACGVNLTATMKDIGIELEWPPVTTTYQIVLVGAKHDAGKGEK